MPPPVSGERPYDPINSCPRRPRGGRRCLAAAASGARADSTGSATIDAIKARGQLVCGIAGNVPGFSLPDSQGVMRGLDADSCRTVAAAILGDANKVKFVPLTTTNRFTALQSGEVDLLVARHHLDARPRGQPRPAVRRR